MMFLNEAIFSLQSTHRVIFIDCFDDQGENMIEKVQLEFSKNFIILDNFPFTHKILKNEMIEIKHMKIKFFEK